MDAERARQQLEAERGRLLQVQRAAGSLTDSEGQSPRSTNPEQYGVEQATETMEREMDNSVLARTQAELDEIEAALERLNTSAYGVCEVCGKPIPDERLQAIPATRYCIEDQAKLEREPWRAR